MRFWVKYSKDGHIKMCTTGHSDAFCWSRTFVWQHHRLFVRKPTQSVIVSYICRMILSVRLCAHEFPEHFYCSISMKTKQFYWFSLCYFFPTFSTWFSIKIIFQLHPQNVENKRKKSIEDDVKQWEIKMKKKIK